MRVLIAGCGYLGLALGAQLRRQGHSVRGLRRSWPDPTPALGAGIEPMLGDLTRPDTLSALADQPIDWVIQCAAPTQGSDLAYRETYVQGTAHLLDVLQPRPPRAFLFVGSTSVYGQTDGSTVQESSPTEPPDFAGRVLLEAESLVHQRSAAMGCDAWILRASGIYGPGRNRLDAFRRGYTTTATATDDASRWMNLIHRDDLAAAVIAVLERRPPSRIFNVCDGTHPTQAEFRDWLVARLRLRNPAPPTRPPPERRARAITNKRVLADRLRRETGWSPAFPDFRFGYEALLRTE